MNLETIILCLTFLIPPMIACPLLLFDGYILPQIGATAIGISLVLITFLFNGFIVYNTFTLLCLVYFVYLIITNVWSTCVHQSEKDVPLVFSYLIGSVLLFNIFSTFQNSFIIVCGAISFITVLLSIYAVAQSYGIDPLFPERVKSRKNDFKDTPINQVAEFYRNDDFKDVRAISTLGNTNFAAGYFICGLPFMFILSSSVSWYLLIISIPVFYAIHRTNSRAGLLSIVGSVIFFLVLCKQKNWIWELLLNSSEIVLFCVQVIIGIGGSFIFIKYLNNIKKMIRFLSKDNNLNNFLDIENPDGSEDVEEIRDHPVAHLRYRFRYWKAAWHMWKKRPIIGYGLRTYRREVYKAQAELNKLTNGKFLDEKRYATPQPRECHNDIIENFVEGGIIGGFLFLIIIIVTFSHGLTYIQLVDNNSALKMIFILTGLVGILIDASFFFPLRLGPSALLFWGLIASGEYLYSKEIGFVKIFSYSPNLFFIFILALFLFGMIYQTSIKQNIANYFFTRHCFSTLSQKRERLLVKAAKFAPNDNVVLMNMAIGYIANFPKISERITTKIYENFDGMIPAWAMCYNYGLAKIFNKDYEMAVELMQESLYYLPYFEPSMHQLKRVWPLAALPPRGVLMKVIDPNVSALINQCAPKEGMSPEQIRILELSVICSILNEKVRLNIPTNWPFNLDFHYFMSPGEINGDYEILEVGHVKLLLAKRRN